MRDLANRIKRHLDRVKSEIQIHNKPYEIYIIYILCIYYMCINYTVHISFYFYFSGRAVQHVGS